MFRFLSDDHNRIDDLVTDAIGPANQIDSKVYDDFRGAPLRHIGMEEKVVLPAVERLLGAPLSAARNCLWSTGRSHRCSFSLSENGANYKYDRRSRQWSLFVSALIFFAGAPLRER